MTSAAAHTGSYGARLTNTSGQYAVTVKSLAQPLADSSVSFWARVSPGGGVQTLAQARDQSSSHFVWSLLYDANHQALWFYPYNGAGASYEICTGPNSVPTSTWFRVEVRYTATPNGGAQLYLNGQTSSAWGVSGDYSQPNGNLARLQLWNDSVSTTDLDDVTVATPPVAAPVAPTGLTATGHDGSVALTWNAPASNGGSPISGYQITGYLNGTALAPPLRSNSASTSYTVTGLANGTAYTFTVAAINAVGMGPDSAASAPVTPVLSTTPGTPTAVQASASDGAAMVSWTAPPSDGGSPITGYYIMPYRNGTAQTAIVTGTDGTRQYIGGLTNGASYTFTVSALNSVGASAESTASASVTPGTTTPYNHAVFSDGFESGALGAWDGTWRSTGKVSVTHAAAHLKSWGARLTNGPGQYALITKALPQPLVDSSVSFWARVSPGGGVQTLAQARDRSTSQFLWSLEYDGTHQGLYFDAWTASGSNETFTGAGSMPTNTWVKLEVQYTATSPGGARLYLNGQTDSAWAFSGNYARNANLQVVQLWNDSTSTTDFDDVQVTIRGPYAPTAPTGVQGTAHDSSVALSWTAPVSDGGSPITNYQITKYVNGTALAPIRTNSASPNYTVAGLVNGSAYTFTVAAINAVGTSPESVPSAPITPVVTTTPGAPTAVQATPSNGGATVSWTAPASDGGSPITSYQIMPFMNGTAQTAIVTPANATQQNIGGLTNGASYTFTVVAVNSVGAGPVSSASSPITPAGLGPG